MPRSNRDDRLEIDFSVQSADVSTPADDDEVFPIAILGDFSGRANHSPGTPVVLAQIDCDNFEKVFAKFGVSLRLVPPGTATEESTLQFRRLEDFHPDELLHRIQPLSRLFDLRGRLLDPARAEAAVAEAEAILKTEVTNTTPLPAAASTETTEELLARLLGKPVTVERPGAASKLDELIKQIVTPSVVPGPSVEQTQLVQLIENELSKGLRHLLHNPNFQALESGWRGIDFLVREAGEQIKFYLIDISKSELLGLVVAGDLTTSAIFTHLEQIRPAVLLGLYIFTLFPQGLKAAPVILY